METRVERQLERALESNTDPDRLLDVVRRFDLPNAEHDTAALPLGATQGQARKGDDLDDRGSSRLKRQRVVGEGPEKVSLFPALGSAFVQTHPNYLRALLGQAEVFGATLNTPNPK